MQDLSCKKHPFVAALECQIKTVKLWEHLGHKKKKGYV